MGLEVFGNLVCFNVPHLDFAVLGSNTEEIFVHLEEARGAKVVFVGLLEGTLARLELDFADYCEALGPVRATHHRAGAELEALPLNFDHGVVGGGLGTANEHGGHGAHRLSLLWLLLGLLFCDGLRFFLFFVLDFISVFVELLFLFFNDYNLGLWGWGLQRSERLLICVDVEEGEEPLGVVGSGPDVDVTFDASCGEILVLEFAEVDDLDDGLGVSELEDVELILLL